MEAEKNAVTNIHESKKATLKALVLLALPAITQQLLGSLLQYVDTAMVGRLGETATATVSTSTTINWLLHSTISGFSVGLLTRISQAYGRENKTEIRQLAALGSRMVLLIGIGLTAFCLLFAPYLPVLMQSAPEIRQGASEYFFTISLSMLFFTSATIFAACMQAVKDTRTPMIISLSSNVLNVLLNWTFIYHFSWGVRGAAWATAISTAVNGIVMFIAFRRKKELRYTAADLLHRSPDLTKKVLSVSLPVTGTSLISCLAYVVFAGMVSGMGVTIFAAHSIAVTAEEIFYLAGYGIRTATSALIGIAIGEQDRKKFMDIRTVSLALTVVLMLISGTALFLVAEPMMRFFTSSETVVKMGARVLRLVAFTEPFFGLMVAWEGINYGTGQTRAVFIIESFSMWGIRILSTWLVIRAGYGLDAVWYCMIADNIFKAIALTIHGLRHSGFPSSVSA